MIDITFQNGVIKTSDTSIYKAKNLLSTQIGSLSYAPNFGIDYDLFFNQDFEIQNETFQSYAMSKLAEFNMNPIEVLGTQEPLEQILKITLGN